MTWRIERAAKKYERAKQRPAIRDLQLAPKSEDTEIEISYSWAPV